MGLAVDSQYLRLSRRVLVALVLLLSVLPVMTPQTVRALEGAVDAIPGSGPVGTSVAVTGTTFTPGQSFTLKLGTSTVKTGLTDVLGNFSVSFQVPPVPRGQYDITVTTPAPDTSSVAYFTVTPQIKLASNSGRVGDQIAVSGTGFLANATVTLLLDNSSGGTVTADSVGSFSNAMLTVPASAKGQHSIAGRDSSGNSPGLPFTTSQIMTVAPASGAVGDKIGVTGRGFAATSPVTISIDGEPVPTASPTTDAVGTFTAGAFVIPSLTAGKHRIVARDADGTDAAADISVTYKVALTPATGTPGTVVRVTGDGFLANQPISIEYDNGPVVTNPTAIVSSGKGSFRGSFEVPGGLTGTYSVEISDGTVTATASFQATLNCTISQTTSAASPGYVGMELTISGSGFKPRTKVTINRDASPPTLLTTSVSDNIGTFSATFTLPPTKSGEHTITATDGTNAKSFNLVIESEPPPVPAPLLPETGTKAGRPVRFHWKDVVDPSGVIYNLQVTSDDKFEKIVLEKDGITTSEYTLSDNETLPSVVKQAPYYWRVQAADNAGNVGDWSADNSFYLGLVLTLPNGEADVTVPAMAVYVGGAATVVIIVFAFWLGRRTTRRRVYVRETLATGRIEDEPPVKLLE
jgi:hypothetical protein